VTANKSIDGLILKIELKAPTPTETAAIAEITVVDVESQLMLFVALKLLDLVSILH